jgi:hypothetical protein
MDTIIQISLHAGEFDQISLTAESILSWLLLGGMLIVLLIGNLRKERG